MGNAARILVIRLSALGNLVQSLGPFAAIRRHHPRSRITLLTTEPYAEWLAGSPYFDEIWIDERPQWWDVPGLLRLRRRLVGAHFDRVYDLQTSARSSRYFSLFGRRARPEWSGIARGCSHPDPNPHRNRLHDFERQAGQLRAAGIMEVPPPDLGWMRGDISRFGLPARFALLVPGSSVHRPAKRWPVSLYAALARELAQAGIASVVIGTGGETPLARRIREETDVTDLTGLTSLGDLASLARAACVAVGNDTGPMHLIAAAGCPSVVLFSADSNPDLCAPWGSSVTVLRRPALHQLPMELVRDAALSLRRPVPDAA